MSVWDVVMAVVFIAAAGVIGLAIGGIGGAAQAHEEISKRKRSLLCPTCEGIGRYKAAMKCPTCRGRGTIVILDPKTEKVDEASPLVNPNQ